MNESEPVFETQIKRFASHSQRNEMEVKEAIGLNGKMISTDEYCKKKIGQLQEEIGRLRKESTQRECIWSKQKNQLLTKAEILNLQNVQLKQRHAQLIKVNQTLQLALTSKTQTNNQPSLRADHQYQAIQQELQQKNKMIKQFRRVNEELKKKITIAQQDKNRAIEAKDQKIDALTCSNKQLMLDQQNRINSFKKQLSSLPFNREIMSSIYRIFNNHLISQELTYEDLSGQYYQSPVTKRFNDNKDWNQRQKNSDSSFSRISGHSIISELNSNKLNSEYSQDEAQGQKLLCEICKKVYDEQEFINHMDQCNRMKLQQDRKKLEKDIRVLDEQHRKSLSQLKRKVTKEIQNPLRQLVSNTNRSNISANKMQKKPAKMMKQPQERATNLSQLFTHQYKSTKFY